MKTIKMQANGKKAEILIYDIIGEDWYGGVSAKQFARDLAALGKLDEINVRINSIGGSLSDAVAIYNTLRANGARVTVDVDAEALSAATIVMMAGDEIRAAENAWIMIHDPWVITMGTAEELRDTADILDKQRGQMLMTYSNRTGVESERISDLMAAETWMTAEEAKNMGFVDSVTETLKVAACFDERFMSKFKNVPKSFRPQMPDNKSDDRISMMRAKLRARNL